jgi:hypothetical protein
MVFCGFYVVSWKRVYINFNSSTEIENQNGIFNHNNYWCFVCRCIHKTKDVCSETNCTAGSYVSFLYLRSDKLYCSGPDFPGQRAGVGIGSSTLFLAINGIDPSLNGIEFEFFTPLKEEFKKKIIIGGIFFVLFCLIIAILRYRKYRNKHKKLVANPGGVWQRPSINAGIQHQHDTSVRKYGTIKYPLFATPCEELGVLGEGIGLYFQFLKYFARVKPNSTVNSIYFELLIMYVNRFSLFCLCYRFLHCISTTVVMPMSRRISFPQVYAVN